jgi:general secretion pathway protein B
MSYILEALKKSDKERQREEIPDLQADHSLPHGKRQARKPPVLPLLGAMVLVLGSIGTLLWWQSSNDKIPQLTGGSKVIPTPLPAVQVPKSGPPEVSRQPVEPLSAAKVQVMEEAVNEEVAEIVKESTPVAAPKTFEQDPAVVPLLEELPPQVRSAIPELSFAGHVYADEAQQRLIIINNRILREGDMISNGLLLERIAPDGVVLRHETAVFRVKLF